MYGSDTESETYQYDSGTDDDVGCPQPRAVASGAMTPPRDLWSEMISAEAQQDGQASSPRGALAAAQPRGGDDDADGASPVASRAGGAQDDDGDAGSCLEDLLASLPLSASYDMSAYDASLGRLGGVSARRDSEDESFCDDSSLAESEGYAPRANGGAFGGGFGGGGGGARSYGAVERGVGAAGDDDDDGASASSRLAGRKRVAARGPSGATPSRRRVKVAAVGVALAATLGVVAFVQGPDGDLPVIRVLKQGARRVRLTMAVARFLAAAESHPPDRPRVGVARQVPGVGERTHAPTRHGAHRARGRRHERARRPRRPEQWPAAIHRRAQDLRARRGRPERPEPLARLEP